VPKKAQIPQERVEYNVFLFDEPLKDSKSLKIFKISLTFRFDKLSNLSKSVHTGENSQILTVSNKKEIFHRPITEHGLFTLYNIIENTDWSFIDNNCELDSEHLFETFLGTIAHNVNVCFPLIKYSPNMAQILKK
jgi:hypothetical protein